MFFNLLTRKERQSTNVFTLGAILFFSVIITSGCFLGVNEEPPPEESIEMAQNEDLSCLSGASGFFGSYADGKSSKKEIASFWNCALKSIRVFKDRTKGKNKDAYRTSELKNFLETFFLKNTELPDSLINEIMLLKKNIFGGNIKVLHNSDIKAIREFIQILKTQMINLNEYFPLTSNNWNKFDPSEFENAQKALVVAGENIGNYFKRVRVEYSVDDFSTLLKEIQNFYGTDTFDSFLNSFPLLTSIKQIVVGPDKNVMHPADWIRLFQNGSRWYGLLLRLQYTYTNYSNWSYGNGQKQTKESLFEFIDLMERSVGAHKNQVIDFDFFYQLINEIDPKTYKPISKKTIKTLLKGFIQRGLGGVDDGPSARSAPGLTLQALSNLKNTVRRWNIGFEYLKGTFQKISDGAGWQTVSVPSIEILSIDPHEALGVKALSELQKDVIFDIREVINKFPQFYFGNDLEMGFIPLRDNRKHSFFDLIQVNWIRQVLHLLLPGYADSKDLKNIYEVGVSRESFRTFFADIETLLREIKILDPRKINQWLQRYYETTLFTFASNGDAFVNLDEGTQFVIFLISSQIFGRRMHQEIAKKCSIGKLDVFDKDLLDPICFRKNFKNKYRTYLRNLPTMMNYYEDVVNSGRADAFQEKLEATGRWMHGFNDKEPVESGDISIITAMFQYVEALYSRYDLDESDTITLNEANVAFEIYSEFLEDFTSFKSEFELQAIFMYLLRYGKPPNRNLWGAVDFWFWRQIREFWSFEANRMDVFQIFSTINQISKPPESDEKEEDPQE